MKKLLTLFILLAMLSALLVIPSSAKKSLDTVTLNVYNWGQYIADGEDDLPDTMTGAEKQALIETIRSHKEKSSVLLYALGPILVTVTYDVIYLYMTVTLGMTF